MITRLWIVWATLLVSLAGAMAAEGPGPVVVVPLKSEVSSAQFFFLRRALKDAEQNGASAFIIDMETYGGEVKAAINNMDALLKTQLPTYTYINPRALSAGALIAIATQQIYMAPTAVIGAAAPVMAGGEDLPKAMSDKTISALSAMARAASQKNGHNPEIADAFIAKEKELKIGDVVIDRADSLLTLSAQEATRQFNGKALLAAGTASSLDDMLRTAGLTGEVRRVEPTGFEQLAIWITALAPLLLLGGIIGAYVEFKTPGFGLPGLLSFICFMLFFTGHYIAGLAGWEVIVCFALGLILVLSELLIHPGTVIPGVAGAVMMVGGLIWAMIDRYPSQPWWPTGDMLVRPLVNLGLATAAAIFVGYLLVRYLPRTSFYHRIVLAAESPSGPGVTIPVERLQLHSGEQGVSKTDLRPAGKAQFGPQIVDVVSEGDWIAAGSTIRVVNIDGTRVVVSANAEQPASLAQG